MESILEKCREHQIAGATVFRGLEGYGESAEIRRPRLLGHEQPLVMVIVDGAENIERLLPVIEGMLDRGMLALSDVEMIRVQKEQYQA